MKYLKPIIDIWQGLKYASDSWQNLGFLTLFRANPTNWSNTLKQFVGKSGRIVWVCLTFLWGLRLKGFKIYGFNQTQILKE